MPLRDFGSVMNLSTLLLSSSGIFLCRVNTEMVVQILNSVMTSRHSWNSIVLDFFSCCLLVDLYCLFMLYVQHHEKFILGSLTCHRS